MPLYRPSELIAFLSSMNRSAKRTLSQNFLIDGNIVKRIIEEADIQPEDVVLEIGPGPGVLTEALLEKKAKVIAVEKDTDFAKMLPRLDPEGKNLLVIEGDVLDVSFEEVLRPFPSKVKVVANLPYHITTPILEQLVFSFHLIDRAVLMVQEEVAVKIVEKKGSLLAILVDSCSNSRIVCKVKKGCFLPKPKVSSCVVVLEGKQCPFQKEPFFELLRVIFSMKRKTIQTSLKTLYDATHVQEALLRAHLEQTSRPEELTLQDFCHIYSVLQLYPKKIP